MANEIHDKLMEALDDNSEYSIDDFNNEFNNVNTTLNINAHKIPLKFVNKSDNPDPAYAKDGDSGFDIRANVEDTVVIQPTRLNITRNTINTGEGRNDAKVIEDVSLIKAETKVIPTGLFFEIPRGYEIQVRSRSGLSAKSQIVVTNSPGTVDSGYRGELKIILTNHGSDVFYVKKGDRIAQCVFTNVIDNKYINLEKVSEISEDTDRGADGLGSSGVE